MWSILLIQRGIWELPIHLPLCVYPPNHDLDCPNPGDVTGVSHLLPVVEGEGVNFCRDGVCDRRSQEAAGFPPSFTLVLHPALHLDHRSD